MSEKGLTNISLKKITNQKFINISIKQVTSNCRLFQIFRWDYPQSARI